MWKEIRAAREIEKQLGYSRSPPFLLCSRTMEPQPHNLSAKTHIHTTPAFSLQHAPGDFSLYLLLEVCERQSAPFAPTCTTFANIKGGDELE